jgi:hypothetical protein
MRDIPCGFDRSKGEARFFLAFLLRSHNTRRGMKTSANNPTTAPPTIAPTGVDFTPADFWAEAEVTRLGMEARLENEGVYIM